MAFVASASAFVAPRAGRATVRMAADLDSMIGVGPESGNKVWVSRQGAQQVAPTPLRNGPTTNRMASPDSVGSDVVRLGLEGMSPIG